MLRTILIAAVVTVICAIAGGTATALLSRDTTPTPAAALPDPATAARTSFPARATAAEPTLPGLATTTPRPGRVASVPGPFDDRLRLSALRLSTAAVTGEVEVISDVSDLLELEVVAGLYDGRGRLLGTARYVHHLDESHLDTGPPTETERFRIAIPAGLRDRVAAAAVGVPVLVNE